MKWCIFITFDAGCWIFVVGVLNDELANSKVPFEGSPVQRSPAPFIQK